MIWKSCRCNGRRWLAGTVLIALAGCQPAEQTHTVDYYRTNAPERTAKVKRCANDPGGEGASVNCFNALRAEELEGIGSFRKLKPLPLPGQAPASEGWK